MQSGRIALFRTQVDPKCLFVACLSNKETLSGGIPKSNRNDRVLLDSIIVRVDAKAILMPGSNNGSL